MMNRLQKWLKGSGKLPSVRQLASGAGRDYRRHWKLLVGITMTVSLPLAIIGLLISDAVVGTYGSFAAVIMNVALIWAVMRVDNGQSASVRTAYYDGTAALVRFMLASIILALQLLPLVIGATIFNSAAVGATAPATIGERVLVGLVWLLLALPSLYWLTHYIFTVFSVNHPGMTPVKALRVSRSATRGRGWAVFGRLAALGGIILGLIIVPTAVALVVVPVSFQNAALALLQLVVSLTILPLSYIYLYKLYLSLA